VFSPPATGRILVFGTAAAAAAYADEADLFLTTAGQHDTVTLSQRTLAIHPRDLPAADRGAIRRCL
jgi:hypothetical protein